MSEEFDQMKAQKERMLQGQVSDEYLRGFDAGAAFVLAAAPPATGQEQGGDEVQNNSVDAAKGTVTPTTAIPKDKAVSAYESKSYFDLNEIAGRRGYSLAHLPYVETPAARRELIDWLTAYDERLLVPTPTTQREGGSVAQNEESPSPASSPESDWISTAATRIETWLFEEGFPITADQRECVFRIICSEVPESSSEPAPEGEGIAERKRLLEIWTRHKDNFRDLGADDWRDQYHADIEYLFAALNQRDSLVKQRNEALDQCAELHERLARYQGGSDKWIAAAAEDLYRQGAGHVFDAGELISIITNHFAAREVITDKEKQNEECK